MQRVSHAAASGLLLLTALFPSFAFAFPFGGQTSTVVPCYNAAIFAQVGAPRGGSYIWTPATKTYQFGPPSFSGQWLLGLASAPYYCIVSIAPVIVWAGVAIDMMGSSGSSGSTIHNLLNGAVPTTAAPPTSTPVNPPSTTPANPTQPATIGHVVVSEVYYSVDSAHGASPLNQWIELFNGSLSNADVSGWTIQNASQQTAIPQGTVIGPTQFLVIMATSSTASFWNIPSSAKIISLNTNAIAGGLSSASDAILLKNASGTLVDGVSWGTNTGAFTPAVAASLTGYALSRKGLAQDTNAASDWAGSSLPTPGK